MQLAQSLEKIWAGSVKSIGDTVFGVQAVAIVRE
jgi:hypothetical protein